MDLSASLNLMWFIISDPISAELGLSFRYSIELLASSISCGSSYGSGDETVCPGVWVGTREFGSSCAPALSLDLSVVRESRVTLRR